MTMLSRSNEALIALRQVQRKTEQASRRLASIVGLTPSQLKVMQLLSEHGELSAGTLSNLTQLRHATLTSLADKLEAKGYIRRHRSAEDKRKVLLNLTPPGLSALTEAPDMLHDLFEQRFSDLPDWHQAMIVSALERVSALLDAEDIDAGPVLDIGEINETPR